MAEQRTVTSLSTEQAASLLMLASPAELTRIAAGGWFRPQGKGAWRLVDVVQGYVRYLRDRASVITTKELRAVLGCGKNMIAELEKDGVIARAGKDAWPWREVLRSYIAHLRSLKQTQPTGTTMVSMEGFARHIGLSREMVRRLVAENVISLAADGKIDQDDARRRYLDHLRNKPHRSQAHDEWRAAKAREVEMRLAERAHELIDISDAKEAIEDAVAAILVELQSLAPRIGGRDLELRRRVDAEVFRIRSNAAERIKAHARSLRETGEPARIGFGSAPPANGGATA
jgi:hypothetical protein